MPAAAQASTTQRGICGGPAELSAAAAAAAVAAVAAASEPTGGIVSALERPRPLFSPTAASGVAAGVAAAGADAPASAFSSGDPPLAVAAANSWCTKPRTYSPYRCSVMAALISRVKRIMNAWQGRHGGQAGDVGGQALA